MVADPQEPFVLVVNPHAGAGLARTRLPQLVRTLREEGGRFEVRETRFAGHATELVRDALRGGAAGVAVVGGDGTVNEALNGFFDDTQAHVAPGAWLAPLPCGTGGDFRRTLGIGRKTAPMARRAMRLGPRPVDVGRLRFRLRDGQPAVRHFLNIASFGIGGLVDELVNGAPKWMGGTTSFLVGSVRAGLRYQNQRVRIRVDDGEPRETAVLNFAVANGQYFGGGMHVAPEARIDDGQLDLVGLENLTFADQVRLMPRIYRGTHLGRPGVTFTRGRKVEAEPCDPAEQVLLDVDGEAPGRLPATFEIVAGALPLRG